MLHDLLAEETHWWLFFGATILFFLGTVELGYRVGRWRRRRAHPEHKTQAGTALTAMLALLGFLLAISFGIAADRFAQRKALVLEEANAVGTTYLRADFLGEPERSEVRELLREYVEVRLQVIRDEGLGLEEGLARSEEIHRALWSRAGAVAEAQPRSVPVGLFVESLNELIDLHEERVTVALHQRVPPSLLWTLYAVAFLSMTTMGLHFGLSGARSIAPTLSLVVSFVAVLLLIVDLDHPVQRLFTVGQDPLVDTLEFMGSEPPDRSLSASSSPSR